MLYWYTGDDDFEIRRQVRERLAQSAVVAEKYQGSDLTIEQLPELLYGMTLFQTQRLIVIDELSQNTPVWQKFADSIAMIDDSTTLILIDKAPDKRTKAYKIVQKSATLYACRAWTDRDQSAAAQWVKTELATRHKVVSLAVARRMVDLVGVNKWQLFQEIEKVSLADEVSVRVIEKLVVSNQTANVFRLSDLLFQGKPREIAELIEQLTATEDPYKVLGLLSQQLVVVSALLSTTQDNKTVARDLAVHPFVVEKLRPVGRQLSAGKVRQIVGSFERADYAMKTSSADAWQSLKSALIQSAQLCVK